MRASLIIAVPTIPVIFRTQGQASPREALEVSVRAYQWWWEFQYPQLGGKRDMVPDLTHFDSRRTVAAGMYPLTLENVAAWIEDPPARKPGAKMPAVPLAKDAVRALAAYLVSLK